LLLDSNRLHGPDNERTFAAIDKLLEVGFFKSRGHKEEHDDQISTDRAYRNKRHDIKYAIMFIRISNKGL